MTQIGEKIFTAELFNYAPTFSFQCSALKRIRIWQIIFNGFKWNSYV